MSTMTQAAPLSHTIASGEIDPVPSNPAPVPTAGWTKERVYKPKGPKYYGWGTMPVELHDHVINSELKRDRYGERQNRMYTDKFADLLERETGW